MGGCCHVHRFENRYRPVAQIGLQPSDEPGRVAEADGVVRPLDLAGLHDLAQHGVDEASGSLGHRPNGRVDGRVWRRVEEDQLVGPEAKRSADARLDVVTHEEPIDDEVERPPHAGRAVHQLGDEAPVSGLEV